MLSKAIKPIFIVCLLLVFCLSITAQRSGSNSSNDNHSFFGGDDSDEDTVALRYITLRDINTEHPVIDSLLDDVEKYATVRSFRKGALTLGNLGSSHLNILYRPKSSILTDPGFHQYDNYKLDAKDFKYYKLGSAYNNLFFSPGGGQSRFQVEAEFSRNFANNVNLSLDLTRINQEGFYSGEDTKSTAFGVGIWKQSQNKNHDLFVTFIANNHNEQNNGGILPPFNTRLRSTLNTFLNDANTRHQHSNYNIDNFFTYKEHYKVHHQLSIDQGFFRYSDDNIRTQQDSVYYGAYATDPKGLRYFLGFNRFKNTFDLGFNTKHIDFNVGLIHQYSRFQSDSGLQVINDLFAIGKLNLTIGKSTQFESRAELGIGNNIGNIKLDGNLNFNFGKGILLSSHLKILRYDPSLIHEDLSLSFTPVINQDFDKINEFSIGGKLLLKKLNLELEFNSGLINNGIFYDNSAFPVQAESNSEYVQIIAVHKLKWRFIGFQNSILSQEFTDNLFRLPSLYSIHNLFLEKSLFNDNLLARVGVLYYNIELDGGLDFLPITGSFYQSDSQDLKYPYTEIYANFRIDNFRVFIKAENIFDGVNSEEHFLINNYPQRDFDLRIGVRWVIRG